ncbi:hypothetical protein GLOIN_2v1782606 [Rhizophagus clarus]|nr:hypothetical protein GLOIN_2v1782606 [Rhizophagus clarus]
MDELSDDEYVVLLRRESFQELLLIPRPNDDESVNYRHYNNEALIQEERFWKDLLSKQESLNFNSIAIHYGAWETGQLQNKYAQEYHVHVHLYFIPEVWYKVKEKVKEKSCSYPSTGNF